MKPSFRVFLLLAVLCSLPLVGKPAFGEDVPTAQAAMAASESKAAAEHKNLLVDFSASWCGNCRLFDRFWSDPQMNPLLTKAFERVTLTIDEHDDKHHDTPGAYEVLRAMGGSRNSGIPFFAIATPAGKPIITNEKKGTPESGIGNPDAPDEIDWFMHMLAVGAPALNAQDRMQIRSWLSARSTHPRG